MDTRKFRVAATLLALMGSIWMDAHAEAPSEEARRLNTRGELAYHANNYELAISLFQQAIALDDRFGQAYSNLGLVFHRTGRTADALWADQKAIAVASQ